MTRIIAYSEGIAALSRNLLNQPGNRRMVVDGCIVNPNIVFDVA